MSETDAAAYHTTRMRRAGRELLSLALMDARNHVLRWISVFEEALAPRGLQVPQQADVLPPLWLLGHAGWYQEYWIARNVQRQRGPACDPAVPRLASIDPGADGWWDPSRSTRAERWSPDLPAIAHVKQYLADTMEITLELLETTDESDDALHFFRHAMFREDMLTETFATLAQTLNLRLGDAQELLAPLSVAAVRSPLMFPALRWMQGAASGGFVFDNEKWAHEVALPEFEIDAQPVTWAQYGEFVEDGGYDDARSWSSDGWEWVQAQGRRVPRHVEQMRQSVLQQRFGRTARVPMSQPVMHVSWFEADAWCRWAGRRLPSEVEWEAAASTGRSRGFRFGDVWEWTATTFRPYPGFLPDPDRTASLPGFGIHKVLRGASFATRGRLVDTRFRHSALPTRDDLFCGFRSCGA